MYRGAVTELQSVSETEEHRAKESTYRLPVAEDDSGQADEPSALNLSLSVDAGLFNGDEGATEAGQTATDYHGKGLHPVHVDSETVRSDWVLTGRPDSQAKTRPPQDHH